MLDAEEAARLTDAEPGGPFGGVMAAVLPSSGEAHQRRRLTSKWFTTRMNALRPETGLRADALVGAMVEQGPPAGLGAGPGFPLPVFVICDTLGVPADELKRVEGLIIGGLNEVPVLCWPPPRPPVPSPARGTGGRAAVSRRSPTGPRGAVRPP
ncbi:hypothetical protein [Nocardiopsis sp. CNT312]|uniref:hypothetical protein n=1 Tax=Nocardiopsis sp. CNT312 TaxID=1137268 RepID=UPI00048E1BB2|nr:hypothetical protein [Nocardiopsis sp. CNT312]